MYSQLLSISISLDTEHRCNTNFKGRLAEGETSLPTCEIHTVSI